MFGSKKFTALAALIVLLVLWQVGFLNWLSGGVMGNTYNVASPIFIGSVKRTLSYFPWNKDRSWFVKICIFVIYVPIFPVVYVLDLVYLLLASLAKRAVAAWKKTWTDDAYFKNSTRGEWQQVYDGVETRGTNGGSDYDDAASSNAGPFEEITLGDDRTKAMPMARVPTSMESPTLSGKQPVWHPASRVEDGQSSPSGVETVSLRGVSPSSEGTVTGSK